MSSMEPGTNKYRLRNFMLAFGGFAVAFFVLWILLS